MRSPGKETIRQRQFIEATIETIHSEGLDRTTVARVARRAGTSAGLVAHYFGDKAGLLQGTFRHLARGLEQELRTRVREETDPLGRLYAVIDANFAETQASPAVVSAWLAFWGQVNHRPELARVQRVVTARLHSNLLYSLRELVPEADARHITTGLAVLIDGLWLRAMLHTGGIHITEARAYAREYLNTQLAAREREMSYA